MAPKQKEMDDVIKRLFEYLRRKDADDGRSSLLVLVGDHGMSEVRSSLNPSFGTPLTREIFQTGNHGGSTEGKTAAVGTSATGSRFIWLNHISLFTGSSFRFPSSRAFRSPSRDRQHARRPLPPTPSRKSDRPCSHSFGPSGTWNPHVSILLVILHHVLTFFSLGTQWEGSSSRSCSVGLPADSKVRACFAFYCDEADERNSNADISDLLRENADQITRVLAVVDTDAPDECRCEALNLRESECFPELQLDHPESISKVFSAAIVFHRGIDSLLNRLPSISRSPNAGFWTISVTTMSAPWREA